MILSDVIGVVLLILGVITGIVGLAWLAPSGPAFLIFGVLLVVAAVVFFKWVVII